MTDQPVDLDAALDGIAEPFDPRIAATVNDYDVKIAKIERPYVWHAHPETDEFFLVLRGRLTIELHGRPAVRLGPHEVFTVPRGLRHLPGGEPGTRVLMFEPRETLNSGDSGAAGTTGRPL
jgi:mannose-6-phosphate isomerase-like protein (cupin superfamily)